MDILQSIKCCQRKLKSIEMERYVRFPSERWCREMSWSWKKAICLQQRLRYRISADARLVSAQSLYVDVSVLTGESLPVARNAEPVTTEKMRASDASNLVLAGSTVAAGRGLAVVYATGTHTEFGQVAHLTATVKREPSTLEVQINRVVHIITAIALGMGVLVFLLTSRGDQLCWCRRQSPNAIKRVSK
jgi:magnesium-transporting ATPase (P-type)